MYFSHAFYLLDKGKSIFCLFLFLSCTFCLFFYYLPDLIYLIAQLFKTLLTHIPTNSYLAWKNWYEKILRHD